MDNPVCNSTERISNKTSTGRRSRKCLHRACFAGISCVQERIPPTIPLSRFPGTAQWLPERLQENVRVASIPISHIWPARTTEEYHLPTRGKAVKGLRKERLERSFPGKQHVRDSSNQVRERERRRAEGNVCSWLEHAAQLQLWPRLCLQRSCGKSISFPTFTLPVAAGSRPLARADLLRKQLPDAPRPRRYRPELCLRTFGDQQHH